MERVSQVIPDAITAILRKAPLCDEKHRARLEHAVAIGEVVTLSSAGPTAMRQANAIFSSQSGALRRMAVMASGMT